LETVKALVGSICAQTVIIRGLSDNNRNMKQVLAGNTFKSFFEQGPTDAHVRGAQFPGTGIIPITNPDGHGLRLKFRQHSNGPWRMKTGMFVQPERPRQRFLRTQLKHPHEKKEQSIFLSRNTKIEQGPSTSRGRLGSCFVHKADASDVHLVLIHTANCRDITHVF